MYEYLSDEELIAIQESASAEVQRHIAGILKARSRALQAIAAVAKFEAKQIKAWEKQMEDK